MTIVVPSSVTGSLPVVRATFDLNEECVSAFFHCPDPWLVVPYEKRIRMRRSKAADHDVFCQISVLSYLAVSNGYKGGRASLQSDRPRTKCLRRRRSDPRRRGETSQ